MCKQLFEMLFKDVVVVVVVVVKLCTEEGAQQINRKINVLVFT